MRNVEGSIWSADFSCCWLLTRLCAESSPPVPSQTNFKVLTDARIGIVKAALQLTPEQEKLWPPVEEAIRARAEARYNRMVAVQGKLGQQGEVDPVEPCVDAPMPWLNELPLSKSSLMHGRRSLKLSIPTRKTGCAFL